jgi:uroporphyrinogen-III synthase
MDSRPVLLIRGLGNDRDERALAIRGIATVSESFTEITPGNSEDALQLLEIAKGVGEWVIITSRNGIDFWGSLVGPKLLATTFSENPRLKFAAIGLGTAALNSLGVAEVITPVERSSQGLLDLLTSYRPSLAIIPTGNLAGRVLPDGLSNLGWTIHSGLVYNNAPVTKVPAAVDQIEDGEFSALLLRSPSAARALAHFLPETKVPLICGDESTAQAARKVSLNVTAVSDDPSPERVAELVARTLEE